jgi:hypothetical protein
MNELGWELPMQRPVEEYLRDEALVKVQEQMGSARVPVALAAEMLAVVELTALLELPLASGLQCLVIAGRLEEILLKRRPTLALPSEPPVGVHGELLIHRKPR